MGGTANRVLVIDDDERLTRLVAEHLEVKGWQCTTAPDGPRGFALAADGGYDLVVVDLGLPGMDGLAIVRELRRVAPSTPVLVMTGSATAENAIRALRHGATDFLTKPFHLRTLDEALARALMGRADGESGGGPSSPAEPVREAASQAPALHRSLNTLLALLESDGSASTNVARSAHEGAGADDRAAAAVEAVARVLALPPDDARRLRWAHRLASLPPETLAGLEALGDAARAARSHAERWDGTGRPARLAGEEIPLVARSLAVAEALAAAANPSSSLPVEDARTALRLGSGRAFDPAVVAACLRLTDKEIAALLSAPPQSSSTSPRCVPSVLPRQSPPVRI